MILVLRALGVGDLATAVPALRGLRAAFPDRRLAVAAPPWLEPLVRLVGGVDELIGVDGLGPVEWRCSAPHWAVNLHGRGPESHRMLLAAGPERLCAFHCVAAGHADGPRWRDEEHEVRRWCRMLGWYGIECDPDDLALARPAPHRVPVGVTVVHPGGKGSERRWAPDRFARLARELTRTGHRVVVTGSRAERDLAERVVGAAGLPSTAVLAGRLGLTELAALVAYGRLVVSADTGIAHLATAYATPSVVLFGPIRPDRWGPPPDRPWHRAIWLPTPEHSAPAGATAAVHPEPTGAGDGSALHPALAAIDVAEVLDAADEVDRARRDRRTVAA